MNLFSDSDCVYLVMEHCEGGDLAEKIKNKKEGKFTFSENEVWLWIDGETLPISTGIVNQSHLKNLQDYLKIKTQVCSILFWSWNLQDTGSTLAWFIKLASTLM